MLQNIVKKVRVRGLKRVPGALTPLVTPAELIQHGSLDSGEDSATLAELIQVATELAEDYTGAVFQTQSWEVYYDAVGTNAEGWDGVRDGAISEFAGFAKAFELPKWPLQSVEIITFRADSGAEVAVNTNTYIYDNTTLPGRVSLRYGSVWPQILGRELAMVKVEFTAGYGANLPAKVKMAIKRLALFMYEHRGDGDTTKDPVAASGALVLLNQIRVMRI